MCNCLRRQLVIDYTEAMVVIDITRASTRGGGNRDHPPPTPIGGRGRDRRQERIRDRAASSSSTSSPWVPKNQREVEEPAARRDEDGSRPTSDRPPVSRFGLLEMSRQRCGLARGVSHSSDRAASASAASQVESMRSRASLARRGAAQGRTARDREVRSPYHYLIDAKREWLAYPRGKERSRSSW